jgi:hypothetical protein
MGIEKRRKCYKRDNENESKKCENTYKVKYLLRRFLSKGKRGVYCNVKKA